MQVGKGQTNSSFVVSNHSIQSETNRSDEQWANQMADQRIVVELKFVVRDV